MKPKIGLFIVIVICFNSLSLAETIQRSLWSIAQNFEPGRPSFPLQNRSSLGASFAHYSNTISYQAIAQLGLGFFEIRALGSQRQTLAMSTATQTVGIELGRYYISSDNHFGRLNVGYTIEPVTSQQFFYLSLNTGILEKESFPWSILFKLQYALSLPSRNYNLLFSSLETSYGFGSYSNRFGSFLNLGLFLNWGYKQKQITTVGLYENMLFGFGPLARLNTIFGTFDFKACFRLFVDQEVYTFGALTSTAYPSEFNTIPNLNFTWNFYF